MRHFTLICGFLLTIGSVSAQSEVPPIAPKKTEQSTDVQDIDFARLKVRELLKEKLFLNPVGVEEVQKYSAILSETDKYSFLREYQISGWWGVANFPYGIGSFVQGDPTTSLLYYAGLLGGSILILYGGFDYSYTGSKVGLGVMITGQAISAASIIFSQVRPWMFASESNVKLRESLSIVSESQ